MESASMARVRSTENTPGKRGHDRRKPPHEFPSFERRGAKWRT